MKQRIEFKLLETYSEMTRKYGEKVSVTTLCKKAGIARATFYLHFKDIEDFIEKSKCSLCEKLIFQAFIFLRCSDKDLSKAIKEENLYMNKEERALLKYFLYGSNYIDFSTMFFKVGIEKTKELKELKDVFQKGLSGEKINYEVFFNGYFSILVLGLSDYEEKRLKKEIENCRLYFKLLLNN